LRAFGADVFCERFSLRTVNYIAPQPSFRQNFQPILAASSQSPNPVINYIFEGAGFGHAVTANTSSEKALTGMLCSIRHFRTIIIRR
jgi:hypothetical protein